MARTQESLAFLASLMMPADVGRRGVLIDAKGWRVDLAGVPPDADVIAWGAWPAPGERGLAFSLRSAFTREVALRTVRLRLPDGFVQTGVHRLPPLVLRPGTIRGRLHAFLSGVRSSRSSVRPASAGSSTSFSRPQVREPKRARSDRARARARGFGRVAKLPRDARAVRSERRRERPARGRRRARAIGGGRDRARSPFLSRGVRDRVSWSAESVLAGATPSRLTPALAQATGRFLATLPASDRMPSAYRRDLVAIGRAFPSRSHEIEMLTGRVDQSSHSVPAVVRHGDLWAGNLLVEGGSLTGVIDWDAWHSEGVPGQRLDVPRRDGSRPKDGPILRAGLVGSPLEVAHPSKGVHRVLVAALATPPARMSSRPPRSRDGRRRSPRR